MTTLIYKSPRELRYFIGVAALFTVAPLLGWVAGFGSFSTFFWTVSVPALLAAVSGIAIAVVRFEDRVLLDVVSVSVVAGVIGTLVYDLFRVPFVFGFGLRLLSPIESYGVLLLGGGGSSGATDFAGWAYHFANGIGFALAYAMFAAGRPWLWGIAWAMILETATIVTPFADAYALRGKVWPIVVAYLAHVPYGLAVGWLLQDPQHTARQLRNVVARPALMALTGLALALAVWLGPWDLPPDRANAVLVGGRLKPEFIQTNGKGCVDIQNMDAVAYSLTLNGEASGEIQAASTHRLCVVGRGVFRLRTSQQPFDGGFIINS